MKNVMIYMLIVLSISLVAHIESACVVETTTIKRIAGGIHRQTEAPLETTEVQNPVVTDAPVEVTDAPVETDAPVKVTDAPVEVTDAPVEVTDAPVEVTDAPVEVTDAPIIETTTSVCDPVPDYCLELNDRKCEVYYDEIGCFNGCKCVVKLYYADPKKKGSYTRATTQAKK
jgi:hypothetical protein